MPGSSEHVVATRSPHRDACLGRRRFAHAKHPLRICSRKYLHSRSAARLRTTTRQDHRRVVSHERRVSAPAAVTRSWHLAHSENETTLSFRAWQRRIQQRTRKSTF